MAQDGKRVRWAPTAQVYILPPKERTPSPSESNPEASSSSASNDTQAESSGSRQPQSPAEISVVTAHPAIAFRDNPFDSEDAIDWDITEYVPLWQEQLDILLNMPIEELAQPATDPPLGNLTIEFNHWQLRWWRPLILEAVSQEEDCGVTVYQVLFGIREYLERVVTVEEFATFTYLPGLQQEVMQAFQSRCGRQDRIRSITQGYTGSPSDSAQIRGIKRVDCLLGKHHFVGITGVLEDSSHWIAHFF